MDKGKYKEFLKDGRWQRKRLEIMERDDFKCKQCGATNDLQVHHLRYFNGRKPWEYSNEDLVTLCGKCHRNAHEHQEEFKTTFINIKEHESFSAFCERLEKMCWNLSFYNYFYGMTILIMLCKRPEGGYFIPFVLECVVPNGTIIGDSLPSNSQFRIWKAKNSLELLRLVRKKVPNSILTEEEYGIVHKSIKDEDVSHILEYAFEERRKPKPKAFDMYDFVKL